MWTIIKYDKKKLSFLKNDFSSKLGKDFIFYNPRLKIEKYNKNKLKKIEINLLGDYIFCFHPKFQKLDKVKDNLKYCRVLNIFLEVTMNLRVKSKILFRSVNLSKIMMALYQKLFLS